MPRCPILLAGGLLVLVLPWARGAEPEAESAAADRDLLRSAGLPTTGPGLLDFFRRSTLSAADRGRLQALIRSLGDDEFRVRERASADLTAAGPVARGLLRAATRDPDIEVARRAERCLEQIERASGPEILAAAVRQLARCRPAGSVPVLLAYLPDVEEELVVAELVRALAAVGVRGGEPDQALLDALTDPLAVKRAAAGEALCRAGCARLPALRRLLKDPDVIVRQRLALARLDAGEKDSIPVLIALLTELPPEQVGQVEDALATVAGDSTPEAVPSGGPGARRRCREAWEAWWKEHGAGLDRARIEGLRRPLGYTLLTLLDMRGGRGRVLELDATGKVRWQIEGLRYPIDAQVLGPGRVLICEYLGRSITERNLQGKVLWRTLAPGLLLGARRLRNGHTFIVTRSRLVEVDRDGKEVAALARPNDVATASRLANGDIALVTVGGEYVRFDASGQQVKAFPVGYVLTMGGNVDVLPNGRVLVPQYRRNRVIEFDSEGREVWEAAVPRPSSVVRLPNGHTLVASRLTRRVIELDRAGKEVWSHQAPGRPFHVSRR